MSDQVEAVPLRFSSAQYLAMVEMENRCRLVAAERERLSVICSSIFCKLFHLCSQSTSEVLDQRARISDLFASLRAQHAASDTRRRLDEDTIARLVRDVAVLQQRCEQSAATMQRELDLAEKRFEQQLSLLRNELAEGEQCNFRASATLRDSNKVHEILLQVTPQQVMLMHSEINLSEIDLVELHSANPCTVHFRASHESVSLSFSDQLTAKEFLARIQPASLENRPPVWKQPWKNQKSKHNHFLASVRSTRDSLISTL